METKRKRNIIVLTLLSAVNLILSVIFILRLPDVVPFHFDIEMKCDLEGVKWVTLFPAILPFSGAAVIPASVKFTKNGSKNEKPVSILGFVLFALFTVINWISLMLADSGARLGEKCSVSGLAWTACVAYGLVFIIIGNIIPTVKQNGMFGFRIKWTLENENCWRSTHRFLGRISFIFGIIYTAVSMLMIICGVSEMVGLACLLFLTLFICAVTAAYAYNHRNG